MALNHTTRSILGDIGRQLRIQAGAAFIRSLSCSSENSVVSPRSQQQEKASSSSGTANEEWNEVVDEKSGQIYYWNQKTGETTELGEPRPSSRFRDHDWEQAAAGSGPFQEGWKEPPGRDLTYFYSIIGSLIGIGAGWATQYTH